LAPRFGSAVVVVMTFSFAARLLKLLLYAAGAGPCCQATAARALD
jgi:hypothetical protein